MVQGEFAAGAALGRGFGIWIKNLPSFLILCVIVYSPLLIYTAMTLSSIGDSVDMADVDRLTRWSLIAGFGGLLLGYIASAPILYGVIQQLRGQHAGIGESIGVGMKRMLPVLGVAIVCVLAMVAGLIALIVPGIIIACMLYAAVPAAVVERPGIGGALKRSQELTSGYKVQIFGILLVLGVLQKVVSYILEKSFIKADMQIGDLKTFAWLTLIIMIVLGSLGAAIQGVVYHDLRVAKEGVATEDLAKVFE
jgi:hypothetical protein